MSYLKQVRAQIILAGFLASSLLLFEFPSVDLYITRAFYHAGFPLKNQWLSSFLGNGIGYLITFAMLAVLALYLFNKASKKSLCNVCGKKVLYLFLVLILGAGLIVNVMLKDNFGRARPRDVEQFGGHKHFTPAFVMTHECSNNCSFSSGHSAGGFFALAFAMALSRRRAALWAALGFGLLVSLSRITSGAHFFSDTVVSFFVMLIVSDALHFRLLLPEALGVAEKSAAPTGTLSPLTLGLDQPLLDHR
jgi:lipid A 4'-phosphatase